MQVQVSQTSIEEHRAYWTDIAKNNGWNKEPFFVQVWVDDTGTVVDSVSYQGLSEDIIVTE